MTWEERIEINPNILVGKPVIKGTRLAVEFVIDLLASGWTENDILHNYPGLTQQDILACLRYVSNILHSEQVFAFNYNITRSNSSSAAFVQLPSASNLA